jgi:hypothetical protein
MIDGMETSCVSRRMLKSNEILRNVDLCCLDNGVIELELFFVSEGRQCKNSQR